MTEAEKAAREWLVSQTMDGAIHPPSDVAQFMAGAEWQRKRDAEEAAEWADARRMLYGGSALKNFAEHLRRSQSELTEEIVR